MSAFQREVFVCLISLFIVSLCVTYVKPFVLNDQSDVSNKSSDLLKITPSDIDNIFTLNGLSSKELQEADGEESAIFVFRYRAPMLFFNLLTKLFL